MPYFAGDTRKTIAPLCLLAAILGVAGECRAITLADAAALPIGSSVTIDEAVVINSTRMSASGQVLIQVRDDTRAVTLYPPAPEFLNGLLNGDVISFTATTASYLGLFELTPSAEPATIVATPTINTSLNPTQVAPVRFNDFSFVAEGLESQYVALANIELFGGWPAYSPGISYSGGDPVAGQPFEQHTTYLARDTGGNETVIWARSQESVDSLNAYFGGAIPAGRFDLPGIVIHAFDDADPPPGTPGINYLLNPVIVGLPGDTNQDGFIGIADLSQLLANWNGARVPPDSLPGDLTHDDFVGIADLNVLLGRWNTGTPPTLAVPEPGSTLLFLAVGTCCVRMRP